MKYLYTLIMTLLISFSYGQTELLSFTFDSDAEGWSAGGDATADDGTFSYESTLGETGGAILVGGSNDGDPEAGRNFFTQFINGAFDYGTSTYLEIEFDLKLFGGSLQATAVHMEVDHPTTGGAGTTTKHLNLENGGLNDTTWTTYTKTVTGIPANSTGNFAIRIMLAAGATTGDGGELLIDNLVVNGYAADPNKYITVSVDATELENNPGFNIVSNHIDVDGPDGNGGNTGVPDGLFTYHDFREYVSTNNSDGTFSYTFTNIPSGQKIEYVWKAYFTDNAVQENLGSIVGGKGTDNYLVSEIPAAETLSTNYFDYGNRTVTSDGDNYTAAMYYFGSIRQTGVAYTEITLNATSGAEAWIRSNKNWDNNGPGGTDNGDDTYTVIVPQTDAFEYVWWYDGTAEDLSPNPNGGQNCTGDSSIVNAGAWYNNDGSLGGYYGNRMHTAGQSRTDTFNTCPAGTLSIIDNELGIIEIYPNPFVDRISVNTEEAIDVVRIYDLTGRMVKQATPNKSNFSLDVADLSKGVYLVKLNAGDKEATTKLIK